jgi:hypothetical protein
MRLEALEVTPMTGRASSRSRRYDVVGSLEADCHDLSMPIFVELRGPTGSSRTNLPDPAGGTFDVAGDFDRFVDQPPYGLVPDGLPILQSIDPFGDTRLPSAVMGRLIADCTRALAVATDGPERWGLLRLRVLAEECSHDPDSTLVWFGD